MFDLGIKNLDLYVTGKCNYCCEYCYGEDDTCGDMSETIYKAALKFGEYICADTIQLCGGEPLMCKEIAKYLEYTKAQGFNVVLRTNGVLLDKYLEVVANTCEWVGISIDGLPKENAVMRTAKGTMTPEEQFEKPMRALWKLKEINPKIKIILASVASRKNSQALPDFAKYLVEHNVPVDKWKVYEFIRDKFRSDKNYEAFEMTETEFHELSEKIKKQMGNEMELILQSAHTERVNANCLIVNQKGDINLDGKNYGNVVSDEFETIVRKLLQDDVLAVISKNKEVTYGGNVK